jgi:hypothetical protein
MLMQICSAVSLVLNIAIGGDYETLCSRTGRNAQAGYVGARRLARVLDGALGFHHCQDSWESTRKRRIRSTLTCH